LTKIKALPEESLSPFQRQVLALEQLLGSQLVVMELARFFSDREVVSDTTVKRWIQNPDYSVPESALETLGKLVEIARETPRNPSVQRFASGLVPLDKFPDLDKCVKTLYFRGYNAMIKAISKKTGESYEQIYKYKFRQLMRHGKKVVKDCLDDWLEKQKKGEPLDVDSKYRTVPKSDVLALLRTYLHLGVFKSKADAARFVSEKSDIRFETIAHKYFYEPSTTLNVPIQVYDALREILNGRVLEYNSRTAYNPGDLLHNGEFEDYGVVETTESKTMTVAWQKKGLL